MRWRSGRLFSGTVICLSLLMTVWHRCQPSDLKHGFFEPLIFVPIPAHRAGRLWSVARYSGPQCVAAGGQFGVLCLGEFEFVAVLLLSVLINFILGGALQRQTDPRRRKQLLAVGVAGNIGFLAVFKYLNPVINTLMHIWGAKSVVSFNFFPLPLGISFFTFHALSYLIDVYRQKHRAATGPEPALRYASSLVWWVIAAGIFCSTPWWRLAKAQLARATDGWSVLGSFLPMAEMILHRADIFPFPGLAGG
jgi:D-alanyl-lipoteichoic acid acyltransferase DltB (MBOAT superfamily)